MPNDDAILENRPGIGFPCIRAPIPSGWREKLWHAFEVSYQPIAAAADISRRWFFHPNHFSAAHLKPAGKISRMIRIREIVDPELRQRITVALAERRGLAVGAVPEWFELDDLDFVDLLNDLKEQEEPQQDWDYPKP